MKISYSYLCCVLKPGWGTVLSVTVYCQGQGQCEDWPTCYEIKKAIKEAVKSIASLSQSFSFMLDSISKIISQSPLLQMKLCDLEGREHNSSLSALQQIFLGGKIIIMHLPVFSFLNQANQIYPVSYLTALSTCLFCSGLHHDLLPIAEVPTSDTTLTVHFLSA